MSETLRTIDGRSVLRMERHLAHPPRKVWRALVEPGRLGRWFPFQVELDARVGGKMTFTDGEWTSTGVITELDPPKVIAYDWEGEHLRWELVPERGGSLLVLTHTFDDHYGAASFAAGWDSCVHGLAELLDGREIGPAGRRIAEHEALVAALGLRDGTVEEDREEDGGEVGGWTVRFERQLTLPAREVWRMLLPASGTPAPGAGVPEAFTAEGVPAAEVTRAEPETELEYTWRDGGRDAGKVRFTLGRGTGHGARLVITQTGPSGLPGARDLALTAWRGHVDALAARVAGAAEQAERAPRAR
ncbi:SRPBCC family protein [Spongiactinospora sp. TRM90649]|uniref:SRPBCC family protein n=1 Tax=Spongiactinospora sp. TRM90649 TaxID=3031114 RepID=UPI0023F66D8E|nr:SRPBCC family protein [Spongiactinospora sp. TRM90649]MDF5756542.1 SRPBCC family protein [Spongiactinospora sp. TRM90649]